MAAKNQAKRKARMPIPAPTVIADFDSPPVLRYILEYTQTPTGNPIKKANKRLDIRAYYHEDGGWPVSLISVRGSGS